jgi:hypothetical protein
MIKFLIIFLQTSLKFILKKVNLRKICVFYISAHSSNFLWVCQKIDCFQQTFHSYYANYCLKKLDYYYHYEQKKWIFTKKKFLLKFKIYSFFLVKFHSFFVYLKEMSLKMKIWRKLRKIQSKTVKKISFLEKKKLVKNPFFCP